MAVGVTPRRPDVVPRRRLPVKDRRREILRAALALIGSRAWDEVSMADVARAARASKPLLYHYFPTKSDLYVAAVRSAADELRRVTHASPETHGAVAARVALAAHLDWIDANADAYRAILQGGRHPDPAVEQIIDESRAEVVERLARGFGFQTLTPARRLALRGWIGFLEGVSMEWLQTRDLPKARVVEILVASLPVAAQVP